MRKPESESSSSTLASQTHPYGLRTQLGQLLPKHALFQVHVLIDSLSNVPLMGGEFGVRWKFKNVQSGSGLLSKMRGTRPWTGGRRKGKGKARPPGLEIEVTPADEEDGAAGDGDAEGDSSAQEDNLDDSADRPSEDSTLFGGRLSTSPPGTPPPPVTPTPALKPTSSTSPESRSVAHGTTRWETLQSYNVKWQHSVNVAVQMDVHRETGDLLPNEMKLVIMQRVIHGDPNSPRRPRVGEVYINLAEYADAGPVTRRYLLRQSKTNATLKLTIELEHIGGEKFYKPPPLRKGEILASVSGLLSNNELLRTSVARQLDDFTRDDSPDSDSDWMEFDDPGTARPRAYPKQQSLGHSYVTPDGRLDTARLVSSYGLRSTENLIEALFNPVPSSHETPTPFTYYTSESELDGSSMSDSLSGGAEQLSMNSTGLDSVSGHSGSSHYADTTAVSYDVNGSTRDIDGGPASASGQGTWWRKMRPHPSTPITRHFKAPPPPLPLQEAVSTR
ncbi:N-terminal C2 in EEIG1 and EHBP1 proteins-domain-containing protein [Amylocystis lapponica]|nr:N-terminal C2 in EEIG1 and EHBP1 proteins-domain-containing protein [Amylocystis lapponica]